MGLSGDTLFTYCIDADNNPYFLNAFTNSGEFLAEGLDATEYGTEKSALPASLAQAGVGFVTLPYEQNYVYNGPTRDLKANLLIEYAKPENYDGDNEIRMTIIGLDDPGSSALQLGFVTTTLIGAMLMLVLTM